MAARVSRFAHRTLARRRSSKPAAAYTLLHLKAAALIALAHSIGNFFKLQLVRQYAFGSAQATEPDTTENAIRCNTGQATEKKSA